MVLGSRSAVKINEYAGRLPDVLFVSAERIRIIQEKALYGTPDWVLEIVSPGDRSGAIKKLAKDYISIGVPEIWLVDLPKGELRLLKATDDYKPRRVDSESVAPDSLPGLILKRVWFFADVRPEPFDIALDLLNRSGDTQFGV